MVGPIWVSRQTIYVLIIYLMLQWLINLSQLNMRLIRWLCRTTIFIHQHVDNATVSICAEILMVEVMIKKVKAFLITRPEVGSQHFNPHVINLKPVLCFPPNCKGGWRTEPSFAPRERKTKCDSVNTLFCLCHWPIGQLVKPSSVRVSKASLE